jgi:hypothetical protein
LHKFTLSNINVPTYLNKDIIIFSTHLFLFVQEEDSIDPIKATLVQGSSKEIDVQLVHSHGESKFLS